MNTILTEINEIALAREPFLKTKLSLEMPTTDHLMSWFYLLPTKAPTTAQKNIAAGFLFLQISRNCHEEIVDTDNGSNGKLVLLGDLFVSHGYQLVIENEDSSLLTEVADIVTQSNEAWFSLRGIKSLEEAAIKNCIDRELGASLRKCAEKGGKNAVWQEERITRYQDCASEIAYLWGCKKHGFPLDTAKSKERALKLGKELQIESDIKKMLTLF